MDETGYLSIVDKLSKMPGVILSMRVDAGYLYLTMKMDIGYSYLTTESSKQRKSITGINRYYDLTAIKKVGLDKIVDAMYHELEGI